jgi:carbonic anhydrase/acetyltransferase-like protein (isoleucine patch superfamily)
MPLVMPHHGKRPVIPPTAYLAPTATVIGDVVLGDHASIWFNTVIRGDVNFIRIGDRSNIQDNSTIHVHINDHPTIVGNDVVGGHNIVLHGCTIKDRVLIGMSSTIMDGVVVGEECIVAAGSLLVPGTIVPARSVVMGRPATVARAVTDDEVEQFIMFGVRNYLEYKETFRGADVIEQDGL